MVVKLFLLFLLLLVRGSYEQQHREILIVGDSLVQVPSAMFNITNMLKIELSKVRHDFDITVRMNALPSLKVEALYEFVENKLATRVKTGEPTPDAVIIYSDTDMSDGGWDGPDKAYRQNLRRLLEMLQTKVNHVAMVGPTFHTKKGELPENWETDECVVGFIEANEEICSEVGAHYINTRKTFQTVILDEIKNNKRQAKQITEFSWDELKKKTINHPHVRESMGILTFDGQHTNEQGTQILVRVIAIEVLRWKDMWRRTDGSGHRHGDMKRRRREEREREMEEEDEKRRRQD